uniref:Uncharacterized protein n=1 Tax=Leersia perrieri TaxID=77586 RepID=A0A0D9XN66_9ORYZ
MLDEGLRPKSPGCVRPGQAATHVTTSFRSLPPTASAQMSEGRRGRPVARAADGGGELRPVGKGAANGGRRREPQAAGGGSRGRQGGVADGRGEVQAGERPRSSGEIQADFFLFFLFF